MLLSTEMIPISDHKRLLRAVDRALSSWMTYAPYLEFFRRRLRNSQALPLEEVPIDVITMNSRFAIRDDETGDTVSYTLVYPEEEAAQEGKLSVLTPFGIALYGAKVGEEVQWITMDGLRVAKVERLFYQPEAAGHAIADPL